MAVKKTATEAELGELHNTVAKVLTNALRCVQKAQDIYLEDDVPLEGPPEVSAPLLSVATKFLADNKITCAPEESSALSDLDAELAAKRKRRDARGLSVGNVVKFEQTA